MLTGLLALPWNTLIRIETILFLSDWVIRIVMLVVVPRRRAPSSARAWLILIFLLPWIGLALYLILGRLRISQRRVKRHATYQQQAQRRLTPGSPAGSAPPITAATSQTTEQPSRPPQDDVAVSAVDGIHDEGNATRAVSLPAPTPVEAHWPEPSYPHLDKWLQPTAALAQALSALPILDGNGADLLDNYEGSIDRLIGDIDDATRHIHVLFYIFADDATGKRVADALLRAARRGVTCRLLIDGLGSRPSLGSLLPRLRAGGVQAHAIAPPSWAHLLRYSETSRIDLRNHRKVVVIDGAIGYTGSQNIVDADFKGGLVYDELVVRLRGPIVGQLQSVFLGDWFLETHELLDNPDLVHDLPASGSIVAQTIPSGPEYPTAANQRLFTSLLYGARSRIVLTSPYFIPDATFLNALETAALRGVDTHLIVSQAADQALVSQAQRSFYAELLEMGVQIHLYRAPRFLHAKHLSIDADLAIIGSSNLDRRSFALNSEISVLFYGHDVASRLRVIEERYMANAHQLTAEEWLKRPWPVKVIQNTARLMDELL